MPRQTAISPRFVLDESEPARLFPAGRRAAHRVAPRPARRRPTRRVERVRRRCATAGERCSASGQARRAACTIAAWPVAGTVNGPGDPNS